MKFSFEGEPIELQLRRNMRIGRARVATASRVALNEARKRILDAGRADIQRGGNFGVRWTQGLQAEITPPEGVTANLILRIFHRVPYWRIFEYGGVIKGRPLLWIPLPWNTFKERARDYPGRLFRVNRKGKNPLLMENDGGGAEAKYVGVKQVRQKRRFHIRPIIRRVAKQMPFLYKRAVRLLNRRRGR